MSEQVMISRELLGRILNCMESDWMKIDMEWGPSEGGLDGEIEKGLYPEIKELRAYVQAIPPPASAQHAGELEGLLRHAQKQVPTGSGLHMRIDAALASIGKEAR